MTACLPVIHPSSNIITHQPSEQTALLMVSPNLLCKVSPDWLTLLHIDYDWLALLLHIDYDRLALLLHINYTHRIDHTSLLLHVLMQ